MTLVVPDKKSLKQQAIHQLRKLLGAVSEDPPPSDPAYEEFKKRYAEISSKYVQEGLAQPSRTRRVFVRKTIPSQRYRCVCLECEARRVARSEERRQCEND